MQQTPDQIGKINWFDLPDDQSISLKLNQIVSEASVEHLSKEEAEKAIKEQIQASGFSNETTLTIRDDVAMGRMISGTTKSPKSDREIGF